MADVSGAQPHGVPVELLNLESLPVAAVCAFCLLLTGAPSAASAAGLHWQHHC